MDERKPKTPQRDPRGRTGAHSAPSAVDGPIVAPSPDQALAPADPPGQSSQIVYCDSEAEVTKGFAIALRAMGLG